MKTGSALALAELLAFAVGIAFGFLWLIDPDGPYEPMIAICGFLGSVFVRMARRGTLTSASDVSRSVVRVEAEARYIVDDVRVTLEDAWYVLTRPFVERYQSWHPSYGDFEPISQRGGKPREFEVRGSSGGRYPWRIEEWDESGRFRTLCG